MTNTSINIKGLGKQFRLNRFQGKRALDAIWDEVRSAISSPGSIDPKDPNKGKSGEWLWALRDVDLEVKEGELIGLIGPNGAGKSTLLKIIAGITAPTTGRIEYHGRVSSLLEAGTGFHSELTGRENIYLNGAILGMSRAEIKRKFDEIVDFSGVENFLDTPIKHYSSGMHIRLGFAVAAHLETEILIVDEVLSVGDAAFIRKCLAKMENIHTSGRTVIFVSHNLTTVSKLCNRGVFLEEGGIRYDGDIATAIDHYQRSAFGNTGEAIIKVNENGPPLQVSCVAVLDIEGKPVGVIKNSVPFSLMFTVVAQEDVKSLIAISVNTLDGINVCSDRYHAGNETLADFRKGETKRFEVAFPNNILNCGSYYFIAQVKPHFATDCDNMSLTQKIQSPPFQVIETVAKKNDQLLKKMSGVIHIPFEWKTDSEFVD